MREVFTLEAAKDAARPRDRPAEQQGIPDDAEPRERVLRLVDHALELYAELTEPRGLFAESLRFDEFD